jgi:hypothetical protein
VTVARRQRRDHRIAPQQPAGEGRIVDRAAGDAEVDPSFAQRFDVQCGPLLAERDRHAGAQAAVGGDEARKGAEEVRAGQPDQHLAFEALRHPLDVAPRGLDAFEDRVGVAQQRPPRLAHLDPAAGAHEQPGAQLVFQVADLQAERRLRQVKALRRARETQLPGDGDEVA